MSAITLENLSDDLLTKLREAAERDCRSLNQQIIHLLEIALHRPKTVEHADAKAQVEAWRKLAGKWESDINKTSPSKPTPPTRDP